MAWARSRPRHRRSLHPSNDPMMQPLLRDKLPEDLPSLLRLLPRA
jgi:hypothetical protein